MQEHGITQGQLAKRSGISKQHVSEMLNKPGKNMRLETKLTLDEACELLARDRAPREEQA